jgi:hypothetical protein
MLAAFSGSEVSMADPVAFSRSGMRHAIPRARLLSPAARGLPARAIWIMQNGLISDRFQVSVDLEGLLSCTESVPDGKSPDRSFSRVLKEPELRKVVALADQAWRAKTPTRKDPAAEQGQLIVLVDGEDALELDTRGRFEAGPAAELFAAVSLLRTSGPSLSEEIKALAEREWAKRIVPGLPPADPAKPDAVYWNTRVSDPFPGEWPEVRSIVYYAHARGFRRTLKDAEVRGPTWAEIRVPLAPSSEPRLSVLNEKIRELGNQGFRPLRKEEREIVLQDPVALLRKPWGPEARVALRGYYCLQRSFGNIPPEAEKSHAGFFRWLACDEPLMISVKATNDARDYVGEDFPIEVSILNQGQEPLGFPLAFVRKTGPSIRLKGRRTKAETYLRTNLADHALKTAFTTIEPGASLSFPWVLHPSELEQLGMPVDVVAEISIATQVQESGNPREFKDAVTLPISRRK